MHMGNVLRTNDVVLATVLAPLTSAKGVWFSLLCGYSSAGEQHSLDECMPALSASWTPRGSKFHPIVMGIASLAHAVDE